MFSAFCGYFGSYFITILHFYKKKKEVIDRESENAAIANVKVSYLFWRLLKAQLINDVFQKQKPMKVTEHPRSSSSAPKKIGKAEAAASPDAKIIEPIHTTAPAPKK